MKVKAISDLKENVKTVNTENNNLDRGKNVNVRKNELERRSDVRPSRTFQPSSIGKESEQQKARKHEEGRPKRKYEKKCVCDVRD